jgi:hypothetical protein
MDDGSEIVVEVPELIHVGVGIRVTIIDTGDGKPIYRWGS